MTTGNADDTPENPIYVIVSATITKPDQITDYAKAAEPLAKQAGMELLVNGKVHLLEGEWTHRGHIVVVEKYSSMDELLHFWYSPEYQEAKKLREGVVDVDFVVAVEAQQ